MIPTDKARQVVFQALTAIRIEASSEEAWGNRLDSFLKTSYPTETAQSS